MDWSAFGSQVLMLLLALVGPVLAALLARGLNALARRWGIQASAEQDRQVYAACERAVVFAEEWARANSGRPTGNEKADIALRCLHDLLDSRTFKEYGEPALRRLLDAAVNDARPTSSGLPQPSLN